AMAMAGWLAGCSSIPDILPDRKVDYKRQKIAEQDLEVPPDLTKAAMRDSLKVPDLTPSPTATYSQYSGERQAAPARAVQADDAVLPVLSNVRVLRDGNERWLEIQAPPDQVWAKVLAFWRSNGILLTEQDPTLGVVKTDWIENRADIKSDVVTNLLRKVADSLYSSGTRDQYRVRIEPGDSSRITLLYLTQRGMEERAVVDRAGQVENMYWAPRANDPGLEAEMLRRLMVYLGSDVERAKQDLAQAAPVATRSQLIKGREGVALQVSEDFARAWRLVGVALDRTGFLVEDRDRSRGLYFVRYDDPTKNEPKSTSWLSKLAFWRSEKAVPKSGSQYQVRLESQGSNTRIVVMDAKGQPEQSETGERILTLVQEHLR
ncbi:MAG: outer membrane protein assembly factor BamC, partial [Pseudomonadota bacterium]